MIIRILSQCKAVLLLLLKEIKYKLCKILGFHGGDYEEWCLLGCYAVWLLLIW
jgi:hypothetical protein